VWETGKAEGVFWNEKGAPGASYFAWCGAVTKFSWKMEGEGRGNEIFVELGAGSWPSTLPPLGKRPVAGAPTV